MYFIIHVCETLNGEWLTFSIPEIKFQNFSLKIYFILKILIASKKKTSNFVSVSVCKSLINFNFNRIIIKNYLFQIEVKYDFIWEYV